MIAWQNASSLYLGNALLGKFDDRAGKHGAANIGLSENEYDY